MYRFYSYSAMSHSGYSRIQLLVGSTLAAALLGGLLYFFIGTTGPIKPYDKARDRDFVVSFFKDNWYWMFTDYTPNYDVDFMVDRRAASQDPKDVDRLIQKVYLVDGKPAGFVFYYVDDFKIGRILFLGVGDAYRKKGYARILARYAIDDLIKRGMSSIRLYTRTDNVRSRALYESLGFKEIWTDGAYMIFEFIP